VRALVVVVIAACGGGSAGPPDAGRPDAGLPDAPPADPLAGAIVELRADVNKDGVVDEGDGAAGWAVVLANLDDDTGRCPAEMYPAVTPDDVLAGCHDAADEVVNGADDLLDLARVHVRGWPEAPAAVTARIAIDPPGRARVFRRTPAGFERVDGALPLADLRAGVELAVEATDIVRDRAVWDGRVLVALVVAAGGAERRDVVELRAAPVILSHHLSPAQRVFATELTFARDPSEEVASAAFREDLAAAATAAGVPEPLFTYAMRDRWMQDLFETGYMAMPAPGGRQHVVRVAFRTPETRDEGSTVPLRVEGRIVFFLRGKDFAAVQQYEPGLPAAMRTLNSFGNTEIVPPYEKDGVRYPFGRILRGSVPDFHPDPSFSRMLEAQGVQPPLTIDTSWLQVAHVDETLAFVPSTNARGWVLLANDPTLARAMLEEASRDGHGDALLFEGRAYSFGAPAQRTVDEVLADPDVMGRSAVAAAEIEAQLAILKAEIGLRDDEIVRVPFLHHTLNGKAVAYQPGTVNLLVLSRTLVLAPDPLGPVVGGVDLFKVQLEDALAAHGITVRWTDVWDLYHRHAGEVHCGTNATRAIPDARWWD
jgi:protein-arginine deiminase